MQFRKRLLSSRIALLLSVSGLVIVFAPVPAAHSQTPTQIPASAGQRWSCRAGADGLWQCDATGSSNSPASVSTSTSRRTPTGRTSQSPAAITTASTRDPALLDWVPRDQLSEEQLQTLQRSCCGMHVEPERTGAYTDLDPTEAPTEIETQQDVSQQPGRSEITGEVSIRQGYRTLQANENTVIDQNEDTVQLSGDVLFREPGILLRGSSAFLDLTEETNVIENASYVLHDTGVHGNAARIIYRSADGSITIDNGEFSRCEPGDEFWLLRARSIQLDPEAGVGRATAVSLRIKDIPVFYYPFTVPFPIGDERVSGFLPPSVSNSSDVGLDLSIPYYANLAPHYDATITPRLIEDRGLMASAELRYLASWSMNTVNLAMLPEDRLFDPGTADIAGDNSPPTDKRWFLGYEHQGMLGANWSTRVDYGAVSDEDYFRDLGSRGLNVESRTHLNKQGQLNFSSANWRAGTNVQRIELIDPLAASIDINKPYDRLPELTLANSFQLDTGLEYGFQAAHVSFDRQLDEGLLQLAQINNGALVTGQRLNFEPTISWPLRTPGAFIIPTAKYRFASWQLDDQALGTDDNPTIGNGVFSLDSGLIFERPLTFFGGRFTQTLEPRLFYLYSDFEEQGQLPNFDTAQLSFGFNQLFRDNRFIGGDRFGDADQVTVALTNRLLDERGREKARFSLGQIFHFEDRRVSLDSPLQSWQAIQPLDTERSALVAELDYGLSEDWRVAADLQWNEDQRKVDEGSFVVHYQSDANHILNLAWRYRENVDIFLSSPPEIDPRIKQTDVSGVWPVNDNWRLLGRWNYDHSNGRNLESFFGVEYSNCCATIRLVGREWIDQYEFLLLQNDPNRGVFFQFSLNGLGNLAGGGLGRLFSDGIPGFQEYETNE